MKKFIYVILFITNIVVTYSLNFSVVPTRYEVELTKVSTNEIYITNNTTEPMRLEAYIEGDKRFGESYNLNDDIVIFPKKIFIKPGGRQTVRFRVKPNSKYIDGEYKSYIVFKEVPYEIKNGDKNSNLTNVSLITEIGVPIYGTKGESVITNKIDKIIVKRGQKNILVQINLENTGNTSSKFSYEIVSKRSITGLKGKIGMSAREGKFSINTEIPIPKELYNQKIKLLIKDQNDKVYYSNTI
ncbi:fimbria/pilus periplasmic chaperone [Fusobacterium sp.]|uniref:fimbria/pilus periplasmic chaperone n=1 Tax=Fusobacterium sp. TaxID=68766 RepID=UPI002612B995|nr:fimbria/pilus periplasmic chaperone [Fusobacterium sp.]